MKSQIIRLRLQTAQNAECETVFSTFGFRLLFKPLFVRSSQSDESWLKEGGAKAGCFWQKMNFTKSLVHDKYGLIWTVNNKILIKYRPIINV